MTIELTPREKLVTAPEVARAIALRRDASGYATALRQVQHWTDRRLLRPVGALRTGTGVARRYLRKPTIPIAAILQELVLLGFTIPDLQPIARHMYSDRHSADGISLSAAINNRQCQLLLAFRVSRGEKRLTVVRLLDGATQASHRELIQRKSRASILIDLAAVFDDIKWPAQV